MKHALSKHAPLLVALGLAAFAGCGPDEVASPAAGSQPTETAATADVPPEPPAPQSTPSTPEPRTGGPSLEGNTISIGKPSNDPFSVIDVEITEPEPFKLKVRVEPELAPDLASAMVSNVGGKGSTSFAINEADGDRISGVLKLDRTTFTIAGRPIDVAGKHLKVAGIDLGPLESYDVVTLTRGEVRVENVFRGPLPAAVEAH